MMKKIYKILLIVGCFFALSFNIYASSSNTTLKDLKDKLASDKSKVNTIAAKQEKVKKQIKSIESELSTVADEIEASEKSIEEAQAKIEELKIDIDNKQIEIDNLINFKEISSGDNVYLEYIFNAKSFTDFIYRVSIIEQLSSYNDSLIDQMNVLIDENEKAKVDLSKKIDNDELLQEKLNTTLSKYNLTIDDLAEDHKDAKADLLASQKEVEAYEKIYKQNGCKDTDTILDCVEIPYADGLTRPVTSGTVTSEYGMRMHPTQHIYKMHYGIDIAVPMNTKVYASAAGIVSKITRVSNPNKKNSSCGGNMVYVKHRIDGKEFTTVYMHLHTIKVKLNDYVTLNSVIGLSGGGESYDYCTTGPHLHFGVYKGSTYVNPRNYVNFPKRLKKFTSRWY